MARAMPKTKKTNKLPLQAPGKCLRRVFEDAGLSANAVAVALRVPANRVTLVIQERNIFGGFGFRDALDVCVYVGEFLV